jgi:hypothetical protein
MASIGGDVSMTHVYYHSIEVTLAEGKPGSIRWRGITYRVLELNDPWHLMDRWWEPPDMTNDPGTPAKGAGSTAGKGRSDRIYYRLHCVSAHEDLACDIYFEAVCGVWILERVYD